MQPELIEEDTEFDYDEFEDLDEFEDFDDDDDDAYDGDAYEDDAYEDDDGDDDSVLADSGEDTEFWPFTRRKRRRRRRRHYRRPRTGHGRGYFKRQLRGYVKRSELRSSLARVGRDVRRNANAVKVNARRISSNRSRIASVARDNRRQTAAIRKMNKDLENARQMSFMMSLLDSGPAEYSVTDVREDGNGKITELRMDKKGDELTMLLPLMMSSGGSGGKGFDNPMMMLLLLGGLK